MLKRINFIINQHLIRWNHRKKCREGLPSVTTSQNFSGDWNAASPMCFVHVSTLNLVLVTEIDGVA